MRRGSSTHRPTRWTRLRCRWDPERIWCRHLPCCNQHSRETSFEASLEANILLLLLLLLLVFLFTMPFFSTTTHMADCWCESGCRSGEECMSVVRVYVCGVCLRVESLKWETRVHSRRTCRRIAEPILEVALAPRTRSVFLSAPQPEKPCVSGILGDFGTHIIVTPVPSRSLLPSSQPKKSTRKHAKRRVSVFFTRLRTLRLV
jgi:hypothetical protein